MNSVTIDPFEKMIRDAGQGWLIDWNAPQEVAIRHLHDLLGRAQAAAQVRLGDDAPQLTADALVAEYARNPHKVQAFLQVIGSLASPDFLVMVWRIIEGMEIEAVQMEYQSSGDFSLQVTISSHEQMRKPEIYRSSDIDDAVVLRHFGIMKMGSQGVFDGFYALRLGPVGK